MDSNKKVIQIIFIAGREITDMLIDSLKSIGIRSINIEAGRRLLLEHAKGLKKIFSNGKSIVDDPVNIVSFLINTELEKDIISFIIAKAGFDIPGRGSVFSKELTVLKSHKDCIVNNLNNKIVSEPKPVLTDISGISCIVQKGEADDIGRVGLDTGASIPSITFGIGTGFRDKLGLWRITIPAEKEICELVVSTHDAETIMDLMIDTGGLNLPGKGFIYLYPLKTGLLNTKFNIGPMSQVASIEQIVTVIDEIKGGAEWRHKDLSAGLGTDKKRKYLNDLINYSVICNEGKSSDLTQVAMSVGASGATICKCKHIYLDNTDTSKITAAREIINLIINESQINKITDALEEYGLFSDEICGQILVYSVSKACTYLGK